MNTDYFVGVDLGQRQDFTAVAVVERKTVATGFDYARYERVTETRFHLRFLERVELGTSYCRVVRRVREVALGLDGCTVVVDRTGVGAPVVDLLREADLGGCTLVPVTITGGDAAVRTGDGWTVPERDLVTGLQVLPEAGTLVFAHGIREGDRLLQELMDMRVRVTSGGHEQFGAWREGSHDDLVLALGLACWKAADERAGGHQGQRLL